MPKHNISWEPLTDSVWNTKLGVLSTEFFSTPPDALHVPLKLSSKGLSSKVSAFLYKLQKTDPVFLGITKKDLIAHVKSPSFEFDIKWIPIICQVFCMSVILLNNADYSITYFPHQTPQKNIILLAGPNNSFSLLGAKFGSKESSKIHKCSFKDDLPSQLSPLTDSTVLMSMHIKTLLNCKSEKLTINNALQQFSKIWMTPLSVEEKKIVIKIIRSHLQSLDFFC